MTSTGAGSKGLKAPSVALSGRQVRLRYEHRSYSVATLIDSKS
jgi:hypothetical protein